MSICIYISFSCKYHVCDVSRSGLLFSSYSSESTLAISSLKDVWDYLIEELVEILED